MANRFPPSVLDPNVRTPERDFRPVDRAVHWGLSWNPRKEIVGGVLENQALDYALNTDTAYVAVAYMAPPVIDPYQRSKWLVLPMASRRDLDEWYEAITSTPERFHYAAAFDKTSRAWSTDNGPVAYSPRKDDGGTQVSGWAEGNWRTPMMLVAGDHGDALQKLVATHELFYSSLIERNPSSRELLSFLHVGWDPFLSAFVARVAAGLTDQDVTAFSQQLSNLRANAAALGLPVPDIGTAGPTVSGRGGGGRGPRRQQRSGGYDSGGAAFYADDGDDDSDVTVSGFTAGRGPIIIGRGRSASPRRFDRGGAGVVYDDGGPLVDNTDDAIVGRGGGGGHGGGGHGPGRGGRGRGRGRYWGGGWGWGPYWGYGYPYPYYFDGPDDDDGDDDGDDQEDEASDETY